MKQLPGLSLPVRVDSESPFELPQCGWERKTGDRPTAEASAIQLSAMTLLITQETTSECKSLAAGAESTEFTQLKFFGAARRPASSQRVLALALERSRQVRQVHRFDAEGKCPRT